MITANEAAIRKLLTEALDAWAEQFDGPKDRDLSVSGADLIDWFSDWRARVKKEMSKLGGAPPARRRRCEPIDCPVNDPDCLGGAGDCHDACRPNLTPEQRRGRRADLRRLRRDDLRRLAEDEASERRGLAVMEGRLADL